MQVRFLQHKHGGRITSITAAEHETYKGVASWFYRGDVEWEDGGKSVGTEIPPWAVCFDHDLPEAKAEYDTVAELLSNHLSSEGRWHDTKFTRDGRAVSWTPSKKAAATPATV